jgi:hypothetical protein
VLRVDGGGLALADTEEVRVETSDVVQETAPLGDRAPGDTRLGVVVLLGIPPAQRDLGDQVDALTQRVPQPLRRLDAARQSAPHPDDGDGGHRPLHHEVPYLFTRAWLRHALTAP